VVLWRSSWVRLGSDATGQLVDMGAATLDMLRIPLPASTAANIKLVGYLRSSDGTTVAATLDYFDALLAYDYCVVESAGLASGETLACYGAQNLSGAGGCRCRVKWRRCWTARISKRNRRGFGGAGACVL
jgi:hypothetical protein